MWSPASVVIWALAVMSRDARTLPHTRDYSALAKIASIIVHEEWHLRHGLDEGGAYDAQLLTLTRIGLGTRPLATCSPSSAI
jgi:hypothetical protein